MKWKERKIPKTVAGSLLEVKSGTEAAHFQGLVLEMKISLLSCRS